MANNYPYYAAPQFYQQPRFMASEQPQSQIGIKGRPVTSIDEVRATTIDFDGSVFYFPDLANKRIYTKQINYDGTSSINTYELRPMINNSQNQYVTREEFERLVLQLQQKFAATQVQSAPQVAQQSPEPNQAEVAAPATAPAPQANQPATPAAPQFNF